MSLLAILTVALSSVKLLFMVQNINLNDIARFDFNLAIAFMAIWQERSVSKAADRLSLSQSALSAALARLRDAAGDPLFVRTRGGMQPTPRAIEMAKNIEHGALLIRDAFRDGLDFNPAQDAHHFALGMSDDFQLAVGPAVSQRLLSEAPNVSVSFHQSNRHTVEKMLETGELDLAVIARPPERSWLAQEQIAQSGYACIFDAVACGCAVPLSLEDYLALPHILVSYSGREGIVDEKLRPLARSRKIQTGLTHFAAVPAFLRGIAAVSTIPTHAALALARISGLQVCAAPLDLGRYPVSLVWRREIQDDAAASWMRMLVRDAVCNHVGIDGGAEVEVTS